jgi:hypothetical protein
MVVVVSNSNPNTNPNINPNTTTTGSKPPLLIVPEATDDSTSPVITHQPQVANSGPVALADIGDPEKKSDQEELSLEALGFFDNSEASTFSPSFDEPERAQDTTTDHVKDAGERGPQTASCQPQLLSQGISSSTQQEMHQEEIPPATTILGKENDEDVSLEEILAALEQASSRVVTSSLGETEKIDDLFAAYDKSFRGKQGRSGGGDQTDLEAFLFKDAPRPVRPTCVLSAADRDDDDSEDDDGDFEL